MEKGAPNQNLGKYRGDLRSTSSESIPTAPTKENETASLLFGMLMGLSDKHSANIEHVAKEISDASSSYLASLLSLEGRKGQFSFNPLRARVSG